MEKPQGNLFFGIMWSIILMIGALLAVDGAIVVGKGIYSIFH